MKTPITRSLILSLCLLVAGCGGGGTGGGSTSVDVATLAVRSRYDELAATFVDTPPGSGLDPLATGRIISDENAGMIVFAEARRYQYTGSAQAKARLLAALDSLVARQDLDNDGHPAWGLGVAWDAFGDKTVNSAEHPYTVTNAIVLEGVLNAIASGALAYDQLLAARKLVADCVRWTIQSTYLSAGYFGYSMFIGDMVPVINVTAYTAGVVLRALDELKAEFTPAEIADYKSKAAACIDSVVREVVMVEGAPQWDYHSDQSPFWAKLKNQPNDVFHHAYIIWGLEMARIHGGVSVPFTRAQYLASLQQYFRGDRLYGYPEKWPFPLGSDFAKPSRVWGPGYCAGIAAFLGDDAMSDRFVNECVTTHAGWPQPQTFPTWFGTSDPVYYARFGANILWGFSLRAYRN